jgi:hypothetical protein
VRRLLLLGIIGLVLASPVAAEAGGNWIEFDKAYPRPGDTVTARLEYYGAGRAELEQHGPYYLWLTPDNHAWHQPPPLGRDALRLGEVHFLGRKGWRAEGTFVVPDIEPGDYVLQVCNDPCTRTIDVDSTWFEVVLDPARAQLRDRLEALRWEIREALEQAERARGLAAAQQDEVETVDVLSARLEALSNRVEDLEQPTLRPEEREGLQAWVPIVGVLAAALAGFAGGRLAGRVQRRGAWLGPPPQEMLPDDEDLTPARS